MVRIAGQILRQRFSAGFAREPDQKIRKIRLAAAPRRGSRLSSFGQTLRPGRSFSRRVSDFGLFHSFYADFKTDFGIFARQSFANCRGLASSSIFLGFAQRLPDALQSRGP